jgi:hypothetical protein
MEKNEVLSLFDQNRKNPGKTFEVEAYFVRQPGKNGAEGMIYYSCYPPGKLIEGINEQIIYFSELQQDFEWKVFEHDQPNNLKETLINQGFIAEPSEAFLVLDLENIPDSSKVNPQVNIKRLTKLDEVTDYEKVLKIIHGEGQQPWLRQEFIEQPEIASLYVAYIKNKPVSIGRLCFDAEQPNFAGFFGGSTLPEYRRQGIYTALVFARIQEAIDKGYRYGYVDALPTSEPILKQLGFEKLSASCPLIWKQNN